MTEPAQAEVRIKPHATAFDVATDLISAQLRVMRAQEAGIIQDRDPEFLHDYRVALRKIRSVLGQFGQVYGKDRTTELKARFSALMRLTGRLRDLDVQLHESQQFRDLVPPTLQPGLDILFQRLAADRKTARSALASHLASTAYRDEIHALTELFDRRKDLRKGRKAGRAIQDHARRLIWKGYGRTRKIARRIGPDTDEARLHRLRIRCKKLRYLMEFCAPFFPAKDLKELIDPLRLLQDSLGRHNDRAVQQRNLRGGLAAMGELLPAARQDVGDSVAALVAALASEQAKERLCAVAQCESFTRPKLRHAVRRLCHR